MKELPPERTFLPAKAKPADVVRVLKTTAAREMLEQFIAGNRIS